MRAITDQLAEIRTRLAELDQLFEEHDSERWRAMTRWHTMHKYMIGSLLLIPLLIGIVLVLVFRGRRDQADVEWKAAKGRVKAVEAERDPLRHQLHRFRTLRGKPALTNGVLDLIRTDMVEAAPVRLVLDGRDFEHQDKLLDLPVPDQRGVHASAWADPWLELGGRFLDKTRFRLTIVTSRQKSEKWKVSLLGKRKKLKKKSWKLVSRAVLQLKVDPARYPRLAELSDPDQALALPELVSDQTLTVGDGRMTLKTSRRAVWTSKPAREEWVAEPSLEWLAAMFLSLYQVLNLAR